MLYNKLHIHIIILLLEIMIEIILKPLKYIVNLFNISINSHFLNKNDKVINKKQVINTKL